MKRFGLIAGIIFCLLSLILSVTFIGPLILLSLAGSLGELSMNLTGSENLQQSTLFVSILISLFALSSYLIQVVRRKQPSKIHLTLLFSLLLVFMNASFCLIIAYQQGVNQTVDLQFIMLSMPLYTCWIYLVLGFFHDLLGMRKK